MIMEVKFNIEAAERLIQSIEIYCVNMQKEAVELLDILELSGLWSDQQAHVFHENIQSVSADLCKALAKENEYLQIYRDRVNDLRGCGR